MAAGSGPQTSSAAPWPAWAGALAGFPIAAAHNLNGALYDLWVTQSDGSGLRRLAQLFDPEPFIAWSPTGRHIAVLGTLGLQIVDVETGAVQQLPRPRGDGPITWGD